MKLFVGAAVGSICIAMGIVVTVSGIAGNAKDFDYETAEAEEQTDWLYRQGKLYRRDLATHLPNGWDDAPKFEVTRVVADRETRAIRYRIEAREQAQLAENAAEFKHKWLERVCKKFIHGPLYKTRVTIVDSYHLLDGSKVFETVVSPKKCDTIYSPMKLTGDNS